MLLAKRFPIRMSHKSTWSDYSSSSAKTYKSGKSLTEKIRDLGFDFPIRRFRRQSLQYMEIKMEDNRPSNYSIIIPNLNLEHIVYFQPEITYDANDPGRQVYTIGTFETGSAKSDEIRRISDITVISYKPTKTMKFRKKKRHSSIIMKIEEILNKHKGPMPPRDPSEESINIQAIEPEREKNIGDLPESILQKIFMYFNTQERNVLLSRVCKTWYYVLKDPMFWTELDFFGDCVKKQTVIALINRYPKLTKLRLTDVEDVVEILQEMCRCNQSITELGVRHCPVSPNNFARIILHVVSCCTNLEVLDIKGMLFQSESFFLQLGRLKNLRSINLTGNKLIRRQDLITLALNCRNLKELKILDLYLDNSNRNAPSPLRDEDWIFVLSHIESNLKTLKIDMQQLRSSTYQAILRCSNLIHLSMKNCLQLSGEVFRQFPTLKKLEKLKVTRGINLKPDDFKYVFEDESFSKIYDLDLNGCWCIGEVGLEAITERLPLLRSLSLKNCKSIKGPHLQHLSRCSELTYLNLAHTDVQYTHLPTLYMHARGLQTLVIDEKMLRTSTLRQLRNFFPSLKIFVSNSQYHKDEKLLN